MINLEKGTQSNTIDAIIKELEDINKLTSKIYSDSYNSYNSYNMSLIRHNTGKILGKTDTLINILKSLDIK